MNLPKLLRLAAVVLSCAVVLMIVGASLLDGIARMRSASVMATAANNFLASLNADQRTKATFKFDDEQRFDWYFVPRDRKGLRVLAGEEDKGRALVQALDEKQRTTAIVSGKAPDDIATMNSRKADPLKPEGIAYSQLNKQQQGLLADLVGEYLARMPQDIADERLKKLRAAKWDKVHFAWAGGINKNEPSYYRVQGPTFLIEYDDTQNNANHIHSVWRDFNGDFGLDLLREHYKTTPHNAGN